MKMSYGLCKVSFELVANLTEAEADVLDEASELLDKPAEERYIYLDFDAAAHPDDKELLANFKANVSPEVFEAVKKLSAHGATFVII